MRNSIGLDRVSTDILTSSNIFAEKYFFMLATQLPIFNLTVCVLLFIRLISKSERDLLSVDHDGPADDMHTVVRHGVKSRGRGSLPRGFGSTECIHTSDQSLEMPDRVIKVFKADQTCKYFMVYKVRVEIETSNMIDDPVL